MRCVCFRAIEICYQIFKVPSRSKCEVCRCEAFVAFCCLALQCPSFYSHGIVNISNQLINMKLFQSEIWSICCLFFAPSWFLGIPITVSIKVWLLLKFIKDAIVVGSLSIGGASRGIIFVWIEKTYFVFHFSQFDLFLDIAKGVMFVTLMKWDLQRNVFQEVATLFSEVFIIRKCFIIEYQSFISLFANYASHISGLFYVI